MTETKILNIEVYRTTEGTPTCAASFPEGKVCVFYQIGNFGKKESCFFDSDEQLVRKNEYGFLIPLKKCPVWSEDVKVD
jgi:hypothetical protein